MRRALFGVAALWEVIRFGLLFALLHGVSGEQSAGFVTTLAWFGSSQLAIAGAFLYAAASSGELSPPGLNSIRIGKALAVVAGGAALFGRMIAAIADGLARTPAEWLSQEPLVIMALAADFIMVMVLLSYHPDTQDENEPRDSHPRRGHLPDCDVTDVEEE